KTAPPFPRESRPAFTHPVESPVSQGGAASGGTESHRGRICQYSTMSPERGPERCGCRPAPPCGGHRARHVLYSPGVDGTPVDRSHETSQVRYDLLDVFPAISA